MSRKTNTAKAIVLAGAVAGAAFGISPAQAAGETITGVGPEKAATTTESTISIKGTNFTEAIKGVKFTPQAGTTGCNATAVVVASSTLIYAKKPATGCAEGSQKVEIFELAANTGTALATFNPAAADIKKTVTFAVPQAVTAIAPTQAAASTGGLAAGGTNVTVTVGATPGLPETGISATLGGKALQSVKRVSATSFTAKTPAGLPGDAQLVVTANGVPSAAFPATPGGAGTWSYKRSVKVTPNIMVRGATAPVVKIDTVGLPLAAPATVVVNFGTVAATEITTGLGKPRTSTTMYVTAPAFPTTAAPVNVSVVVDPDGAGALAPVTSVVTGTSGFVYSDY